jgi:hypothetical protein
MFRQPTPISAGQRETKVSVIGRPFRPVIPKAARKPDTTHKPRDTWPGARNRQEEINWIEILMIGRSLEADGVYANVPHGMRINRMRCNEAVLIAASEDTADSCKYLAQVCVVLSGHGLGPSVKDAVY